MSAQEQYLRASEISVPLLRYVHIGKEEADLGGQNQAC